MKFKKDNYSDSYYSELSIIINQQSILAQKVGILLAVNTLIIGAIINLSDAINWWLLFLIIPALISLLMCVYVLFPNFKTSENSKYFYDFANMNESNIEISIQNISNTISQIKINSNILKKKYQLFKHSLAITFIGIPYVFILFNRMQK